jgi:hypothetical protein
MLNCYTAGNIMRTLSAFCFAGLCLIPLMSAALADDATMPNITTHAFPLSAVRLLDGPFKTAMDADAKYLLSLDADRLLAGYRLNAGLPPKATVYGGWESRGVCGHTLGHYLSACSLMFASTGDDRFRTRVNYIVDELTACQDAVPDHFLGGMPNGRPLFEAIAKGGFDANGGFDLHGAWVPWYNEHKLFAGLRDAWLYTGSEKAKLILTRLGDWAISVCQNLDDTQMQRMLGVEYGGMNEVLADLTAITGDPKYLALAKRFWQKSTLDPLADGRDDLTGLHANTQIPKLIGAARIYELTGDPHYKTAAQTFWTAVTQNRSFVTGSNSDREHFFPLGVEAAKLGPENGETCNVYNMLKLTAHLASWTGSSAPYDYYERALYNHILASINPDSGTGMYFVPLEPGRFKIFSSTDNSFWCCTGTGMENHAKYGADIYTHDTDSLNINLFIASQLTWPDHGLTLRQDTTFPTTDFSTITFKLDHPTPFKLKVRIPAWATQGITIDGAINAHGNPGADYLLLDRTWNDGDTITIHLPMSLHLHHAIDDPTMTAIEYGPIVLAARLGTDDLPDSNLVHDQTVYDNRPVPPVPMVVTESSSLDWLALVSNAPLHFRTRGVGKPTELDFVPFYQIHRERYEVYFRQLNAEQYQSLQSKLSAQEQAARDLAARTVDEITFGEQQPEQDHQLQSANSRTGIWNSKPWRDVTAGGFFSARLRVNPDQKQLLHLTYWGGDTNRTFDILIDGQLLATQTLSAQHPKDFFDVDYPLPMSLIQNKQQITIEFRPHGNSIAGGIFGCRVLLDHAQ